MKKVVGFLIIGCFCLSMIVIAADDFSNVGKKLKSFGKKTASRGVAGLSEGELEALVNEIIEITIEECRQTPDCEEPSEEEVVDGRKEIRELLLENPQALEEAKDSNGEVNVVKLIEIIKNQSKKEIDIVLTQGNIILLEMSLTLYELDNGFYPSTSQGLLALIEKPTSGPKPTTWHGPYANEMLEDPWENPYHYVYPGIHNRDKFDISSYGPDEVESDDDITNWD